MAGFMAGFGQAFQESFNSARKRRHEKEENAIDRNFREAMSEREHIRTMELESKRDAREAKRLAAQHEFQQRQLELQQQFQDYMAGKEQQWRTGERVAGETHSDNQFDRRVKVEDGRRTEDRKYAVEDRNFNAGERISDREDSQEFTREINKDNREHDTKIRKDDRDADQANTLVRMDKQNQFDIDKENRAREAKRSADMSLAIRLSEMHDGEINPEKVAEYFGAIQDGIDVEAKLKEGFTLETTKKPPSATTPASSQTGDIFTSVPPDLQPASATTGAVAPGDFAPKWKKPAGKGPYDNLGEQDIINRLADLESKGQTGSEEYQALDNMLQKRLVYEGQKAVKTGGKAPLSVVIERDPVTKQGKFVDVYQDGNIVKERGTDRVLENYEDATGVMKEVDETLKNVRPRIDKYDERILNFKDGVTTASKMKEILGRSPDANALGGSIARVTDEWARDVVSGVTQVRDIVGNLVNNGDPNGLAVVDKAVKDLEDTTNNLLSKGIQNPALDAALLDSYKLRMTYAILSSHGQDGKAVNKDEFNRQFGDLSNANRQSVYEKLDGWVRDTKTSLDTEYQLINEHNTDVQRLEKKYGIKSLGSSSPPETFVGDYQFSDRHSMEQGNAPVQIPADASKEEQRALYESLPSGTRYMDPLGNPRTKK